MFLVSFLIGPIFDAGYLHQLLLIGSLLSALGLFMTSLCTIYWQIFLAQGVAMGIGFGCLYLPAPALVSMHFNRHQALAMGLSSSGSGIGTVLMHRRCFERPSANADSSQALLYSRWCSHTWNPA
jgi:MFS family permease